MRMSFSQAKELVAQEQDDAVVEECSAYEPTLEPEYMSENEAIAKLLRESGQDQLVRCMNDGCMDNPEPSPRGVALAKQAKLLEEWRQYAVATTISHESVMNFKQWLDKVKLIDHAGLTM